MGVETIVAAVFSLLGGGGIVAVVQAIVGKRRNKLEADGLVVKHAIELEKVAVDRYMTSIQRLDMAEKLLLEVRRELEASQTYVDKCLDLLRKNGIPIPERGHCEQHRSNH